MNVNKKKLIKEVQRHRSLYDTRHKEFSSLDAKGTAWEEIATALEKDVQICQNTWIDLRYNYQNYARKLRKFIRSNNMSQKQRPVMEFERELLFLWRFVADNKRSRCHITSAYKSINGISAQAAQTVDSDVVAVKDIKYDLVVDLDNYEEYENPLGTNDKCNKNNFAITPKIHKLVELLKAYPELYDISNIYYMDYRRKGIIWRALANELNENVRIHCKLSYYLRRCWHEPMNDPKQIIHLLSTLHVLRNPIIFTTAQQAEDSAYVKLWIEIGTMKGFATTTPAQCEFTWLVMRKIYWNLVNMRKHGWHLQDDWHFESIVADLYDHTNQNKQISSKSIEEDITSNSYAIQESIDPTLNSPVVQSAPVQFVSTSNVSATSGQSSNSLISSANLLPTTTTTIYGQTRLTFIPNSSLTIKPVLSSIPSSFTSANGKVSTASLSSSSPLISYRPSQRSACTSSLSTQPVLSSTSIPQFASTSKVVSFSTKHDKPVNAIPARSSPILLSALSSTSQPALPPISPSVSTFNEEIPSTSTPLESNKPDEIPTASIPLKSNEPAQKSKITENLLYPNKMRIELVVGPAQNLLIVDSPTKKYLFPMKRVALFIRYVMAIPHLHNKEFTLSDTTKYWEYLSKHFDLPTYVCIAMWDFLSDNFEHFNSIAPMRELMKPFPHFADMKIWMDSDELCVDLDELAVNKGLKNCIDKLPALMSEMSCHPEMYIKHIVPSVVHYKFPNIPNVGEVCLAFKDAFLCYMLDLEKGIARKWPQKWWRVLVQLTFLVHVRYNKLEPFYYIVKNKICEEIERCTKVEQIKALNKAADVEKPSHFTHLISDLNFDHPYQLLLHIRQNPYIYMNCTKTEKSKAWKEVAAKMHLTVAECQHIFERALKLILVLKKRDLGGRCKLNFSYYKNLLYIHDIVKHKRLRVTEPVGVILPEQFVPDINMDNSPPKLVMKNWCYAIQNLPTVAQRGAKLNAIKSLFLKYQKLNGNENLKA